MKNIILSNNEIEMLLRAISMMKDFRVEGSEEWKKLYLDICNQVNDLKFKEALKENNRKEICNLKG